LTTLGDEDIGGLDVAVNDAFRVRGIQSVGNLDSEGENQVRLHRAIADAVLQRHAVQKLHGDEGSPVRLVDLVDSADVRVVQRRRSLGFALESAESLRVVGEFVGKKLQSDVATQLQVFAFADHTHATTADLAEDAVMGNRLPHRLGGRSH
jgi:hypothetical protein